jgi:hypothetical protein
VPRLCLGPKHIPDQRRKPLKPFAVTERCSRICANDSGRRAGGRLRYTDDVIARVAGQRGWADSLIRSVVTSLDEEGTAIGDLQVLPGSGPRQLVSRGQPWCCSWCEILGIAEGIRVWWGESSTQIRW